MKAVVGDFKFFCKQLQLLTIFAVNTIHRLFVILNQRVFLSARTENKANMSLTIINKLRCVFPLHLPFYLYFQLLFAGCFSQKKPHPRVLLYSHSKNKYFPYLINSIRILLSLCNVYNTRKCRWANHSKLCSTDWLNYFN